MITKRAILACLLAALPALAHHRLEAQYDRNRPITLKGTVTKVAWTNPHVRLYIDAPGDHGQMMWDFEMASPNSLFRGGWKIDTLRRGDHVTVNAYPARDGSTAGFATKVTMTVP